MASDLATHTATAGTLSAYAMQELEAQLLADEATIANLLISTARMRRQLIQQRGKHFRFLDLPRELRDMVYKLCVAPGKCFLSGPAPFDPRYRDCIEHQIQWQLLMVSRQVGEEAGQIMVASNMLVVCFPACDPYGPQVYCPVTLVPYQTPLSPFISKYLTSVSIPFDTRTLVRDPLAFAHAVRHITNPLHNRLTDDVVLDLGHKASQWSGNNWLKFLEAVICPTLRFLQIDLTYCYCPLGCCRAVAEVDEVFHSLFVNPRLEAIEVLGTKTQVERDLFLREGLIADPRMRTEEQANVVLLDKKIKVRFTTPQIGEHKMYAHFDKDGHEGLEDVETETDLKIGGTTRTGMTALSDGIDLTYQT